MRSLLAVLLVPLGWTVSAAITYVDATTANTTLEGGTPLISGSNFTSSSTEGAMDGLWHLRTAVGNGGNGVWTADEPATGSEDVPRLVTTINFSQPGGYRLFAYIWDSDDAGEDWDVRFRVGATGSFSTVRASELELASSANFSVPIATSEGPRRLIQVPLGVLVLPAAGAAQIYIDDDATVGSRCTWYDGVGYEKIFSALGERLIAIDFNKTNAPAAPSQAMFRSMSGSSVSSQNSTNITKRIAPYTVALSKSSAARFDFRGANGDSTRVIPGGPASLSFLVADFIGGRDGTINIALSNLAAGTYLFRSYHLDPFNSANLGFAQGSSTINPNTIRAHVAGALEAITQATALGPAGLGTNFISDADIPTLTFPLSCDGTTVTVNLSSVYTNGLDRFILLNGFEVFSAIP